MFENIRLSLQGILSHKIRSFLTMLGIIIGIAAIIAIVSTIEGTNAQIKNNLIGAGNNTVTVQLMQGEWPYDFSYNAPPENVRMISEKYKQRILDQKEISACTLYRTRSNAESVWYVDQRLESSSIIGIDEDYLSTMVYEIAEGIGFTDEQYHDFSKVLLVDSSIERGLFNGESPIGKVIDIYGEPFTIIGVVAKRSGFEPTINSVDDYFMYNQTTSGQIFMPTNDWGICFRYDEPQNCVVQAVDTDSMTMAGKKTADILNENVRKMSLDGEGETENPELGMGSVEYKSESLLEQAKALQDLSKSTNNMLIWIASISLLVGGIGVMNIMLVSVTERTPEIGLKKALGARRRRISAQFLIEAGVLTCLGGILGIIVGVVLAYAISSMSGVPIFISWYIVILTVVFSFVIGMFFGAIPAYRAARLDPIDALRHE